MTARTPWVALALVLGLESLAMAEDYEADPSTYLQALASLQPGDRLLLGPGEYPGLLLEDMHGEDGRPITIEGPSSGLRATIVGRPCCSTISLVDSSYLVIRELDIDVRGELRDGVKAESSSESVHHITLEHLNIFNIGKDQQRVGISTKCPAWDWVIRYNTVYDAGTGLYLGDSDGTHPFIRGVIEYNLVVDPIGYGMQIKHQIPRPNPPGIPVESSVTIIRHNVFIKATGASLGDEARPNLLVGHLPPSGPGSEDRYEIYGNLLYENESGTEALFQGEGNVAFHDNILVNSFGDGVRIQPHNDVPKEIAIYHNTIYTTDRGIGITGGSPMFRQRAVANVVLSGAASPIEGGETRDNITGSLLEATSYFVMPSFELGSMDFYPLPGALRGGVIDLTDFAEHLDRDIDFNGTVRDGTFRGAYAGSGTNPGWPLAESIKTLVEDGRPEPDGGVVDDAGQVPGFDAGYPDADGPSVEEDSAVGCGCRDVRSTPAGGALIGFALLLGLASLRKRD